MLTMLELRLVTGKIVLFWANTSAQSSHFVQFLNPTGQRGDTGRQRDPQSLTIPPEKRQLFCTKLCDDRLCETRNDNS